MAATPETMAYVDHGQGGTPAVMQMARRPTPRPRPDELLIRNIAIGVNRPDVAQRSGSYPPPPGASPVLGLECAGEVVGVGDAVKGWQVGDMACALCNGGAYAEYVVAPAAQCLPFPSGYDAVRAAALPENFFTVWSNIFGHGQLQRGETLLVHGGTSGIGITAIQLAKAFGAGVIATAGSDEKCDAIRRFGGDQAINYRTTDFLEGVREHTSRRGVDVILDMVAGAYLQRNLEALAERGRLVIIGGLGGAIAKEVDLRPIMTRRLVITGSTLRPRSSAEKEAIGLALREQVWPMLASGDLRGPEIYRRFPLGEAAAAHVLMESSEHIGKIMLTV